MGQSAMAGDLKKRGGEQGLFCFFGPEKQKKKPKNWLAACICCFFRVSNLKTISFESYTKIKQGTKKFNHFQPLMKPTAIEKFLSLPQLSSKKLRHSD